MGVPLGGSASQDTAALAGQLVAGTFTAAGQSNPKAFFGDFNVLIWGTFVGTVQIERSFDGGTTWLVENLDSSGSAASWSVPVSVEVYEPEHQVGYRLNCTAYTSGTINYRLSQSVDLYNDANEGDGR